GSAAPGGALRERLARLSAARPRRWAGGPGGVLPRCRRRASGRHRAAASARVRAGGPDPAVADPPVTLARVTERRWALGTLLVAGIAFAVVAALFIPWHPVPGGTPSAVPARDVFTPEQIARANAYTDPARHLGWASLAVSLVVTVVLGFTSLGP